MVANPFFVDFDRIGDCQMNDFRGEKRQLQHVGDKRPFLAEMLCQFGHVGEQPLVQPLLPQDTASDCRQQRRLVLHRPDVFRNVEVQRKRLFPGDGNATPDFGDDRA